MSGMLLVVFGVLLSVVYSRRLRDIETIDTELMLADMQSLEGMIDKAQKNIRLGGPVKTR